MISFGNSKRCIADCDKKRMNTCTWLNGVNLQEQDNYAHQVRQISNKPEDIHLETLDCLETNVQTSVSNYAFLKKNRTCWHCRWFIARLRERERERERTERSPPATTLTHSKFVGKQAAGSGLWLARQREKHQICNKYGSYGWIVPF